MMYRLPKIWNKRRAGLFIFRTVIGTWKPSTVSVQVTEYALPLHKIMYFFFDSFPNKDDSSQKNCYGQNYWWPGQNNGLFYLLRLKT